MTALRTCPDHGPFAGRGCPACDGAGEQVVSGPQREHLSKFVSGVLRHFPEDADLALDERGWTDYDDLVRAVTERYDWADPEGVAAVVVTDPKGRFERSGGRIRAAYGHSVDVELEALETPVPEELYHGTDPGSVPAIREQGLKPMDRQQVHLSETVEEAREVGERRADEPAILAVDAAEMECDGHRIVRRGEGVYTTDRVPPAYLTMWE